MRAIAMILAAGSLLLGACQSEKNTDSPDMGTPKGFAGVKLTPSADLRTTENGGTDRFTVVLEAEPTAAVSLRFSSSNPKEGTINPSELVFTPQNWSAPRTITVTGVDDKVADGPQNYLIVSEPAVSNDPRYDGLDPADVTVTNTDDETAGINTMTAGALKTSEAGGTAQATISLTTQPSAEVILSVSSDTPQEGTVAPAQLTFSAENWNAGQTITITGVDDNQADGDQNYRIKISASQSSDADYAKLPEQFLNVVNVDNETAGITVLNATNLSVSEQGTTASFQIVLNSAPAQEVSLPVASSDSEEVTASPAQIVFTAQNWNAPQTVTLTGVDDQETDGEQIVAIRLGPSQSSDSNYQDLSPGDVSVICVDDESPGVLVTPVTGLTTSESGGSATFTVVLASRPSADVTIALTSSDPSEGTVRPASLTFSPQNWNATQTVVATGVDDQLADGDQNYTVLTGAASSSDTNYAGVNGPDVSLVNLDDETAGFTVAPQSGLILTEDGGSDTFTVVLTTAPQTEVRIPLEVSDSTEASLSTAQLTFTPMNWNAPQRVTVTGVNDPVADGDQPVTIRLQAAMSADTSYNQLDPPNVTAINLDDETPGITVSPTTNLVTTEDGGTETIQVVLDTPPTHPVTIPVSSSNPAEGQVSTSMLVFTSTSWQTPQNIVVTGVDDPIADGDQNYRVILGAAQSLDPAYSGIDPVDPQLDNADDETPGFTVTPSTGLLTTEDGGEDRFTVVLDTQPTAEVTINVRSSDTSEGTVNTSSLIFSATNWNMPQVVIATGVNDAVVDGDQVFTVILDPASSTDNVYNGLDPIDPMYTNLDDD